jgi:DNA-binding transcriptional LysR family regulator
MTHDLEIRHCRVLVAVSEHRSVSAAARELGVAQSTLSEALLSLERVIGAPIMLRRPGREATLTPAAETLLPHARALIAASMAAVAAVSPGSAGVIRLGTVESLSSYILPGALTEFRALWPSIEVQINIGLCNDLRARARRGDLDAVLTLDGGQDEEVQEGVLGRNLAPARLCLLVSSGPPAGGAPLNKAELSGRTFLLPDPDGAFPTLMRSWLGTLAKKSRFMSAGSIGGVIRGVQNDDVIGVLPHYAVADQLAAASLHELKVRESLPEVFVGLTVHLEPPVASPLQYLILQIERSLLRLNPR